MSQNSKGKAQDERPSASYPSLCLYAILPGGLLEEPRGPWTRIRSGPRA